MGVSLPISVQLTYASLTLHRILPIEAPQVIPSMGVPQNGGLIMENPIQTDDLLVVPLFYIALFYSTLLYSTFFSVSVTRKLPPRLPSKICLYMWVQCFFACGLCSADQHAGVRPTVHHCSRPLESLVRRMEDRCDVTGMMMRIEVYNYPNIALISSWWIYEVRQRASPASLYEVSRNILCCQFPPVFC